MLNLFLNLIYPPRCVFCRAALEPNSKINVCIQCTNNLPYCLAKPRCRICGKPTGDDVGVKVCEYCRQHKYHSYTRIISAFEYSGLVRDSIIRYKAKSLKRYGREYARFMCLQVQADYRGIEFDLVTAVPPSKKRMREKGFDQSGYLARQVSGQLGLVYVQHMLYQKEEKKKQSSLSFEDRFENVFHNIGVKRRAAVNEKKILLVDDICTTRATLEECARALRAAGAACVYAVTAATTCKKEG